MERAPLKVLVIDDSELAREQLRSMLTAAGMPVFELPSAIGATREALRNGVDAAVVDLTLPGLSGDRLIGLLRANRRLQGLVLVVVSGRTAEELQDLAVAADAVIPKDRAARDLVLELRALVAQAGRQLERGPHV